jgi:hypothetical protein
MKTTILGVLIIISTVLNGIVKILNGEPLDIYHDGASIAAGVGLINAADSKPKP